MCGCSALMRMQAAKCAGFTSTSGGTTCLHAGTMNGQRVWKRHPCGGLIGDGTSLSRTMRFLVASIAGSGIGTAEISAFVYGISGSS